jgi:hypothetical protein
MYIRTLAVFEPTPIQKFNHSSNQIVIDSYYIPQLPKIKTKRKMFDYSEFIRKKRIYNNQIEHKGI